MITKRHGLYASLGVHALVAGAAVYWQFHQTLPAANSVGGGGVESDSAKGGPMPMVEPMAVKVAAPIRSQPTHRIPPKANAPRLSANTANPVVLAKPPPLLHVVASAPPVPVSQPAAVPVRPVAVVGSSPGKSMGSGKIAGSGKEKDSGKGVGKGIGKGKSGRGSGDGSGSQQARYLTKAPLDYPAKAQRLGQEGTVKVKLLIDAIGKCQSVKIHTSSGYPLLDAAAVQCAEKCSYYPPQLNGQPTTAWVEASFRFAL